ncbi:hypothetical protein GCM10023214_48790 [Amycolatopsis dongchuanensis]|uniref:Ribonuclease H n=1 Tax=Amycolatopsis dongchuanensis TaxID=1070866 RepID=A0ABP9R0V0_9PSEU
MGEAFVEIYTDGACSPNPGPGGWGVVLRYGGHERELYGPDPGPTTNNRMELMAAIQALETLKRPSAVRLYTDSTYVRSGVLSWMPRWKGNGWLTSAKQPVKNADLWRRLDAALHRHEVEWHWVKGHAGHPDNERADRLAVRGAKEAAKLPPAPVAPEPEPVEEEGVLPLAVRRQVPGPQASGSRASTAQASGGERRQGGPAPAVWVHAGAPGDTGQARPASAAPAGGRARPATAGAASQPGRAPSAAATDPHPAVPAATIQAHPASAAPTASGRQQGKPLPPATQPGAAALAPTNPHPTPPAPKPPPDEDECVHQMPVSWCALCKPLPPGVLPRGYRVEGYAYHNDPHCLWLHKGQRRAARQGMNIHEPVPIAWAEVSPGELVPCEYCCTPAWVRRHAR